MRGSVLSLQVLVFASAGLSLLAGEPVQFNRDIRPILSEKCFSCHGPDEAKRMTALRLDTAAGAATAVGTGRRAIVPGDPDRSEVFLRVSTADSARRMPPAAMGHERLSDREIDILHQWIKEGAPWQGHWAFLPPRRPAVPFAEQPGWPANPIDNFVLSRLQAAGLKPAPPASRATLIRRLSLDLTGTPPQLSEIDDFLTDESGEAYETVVDRLLASPRYAERMAVRWLDAARYADTNGYQTDAARDMWRWRDWVLEAFSSNKPFDEFTVDQIAGDMIPDARLDQIIATGFNRNHRSNGEGGIVDAEYAVEYVVDRVDTTSTVWLGLTLGCARCHDHKYDPFTQREYYELFAYFNNVPEKGKAFKYGNSPPFVKAPTAAQQAALARIDKRLTALQAARADLEKRHKESRSRWERDIVHSPREWIDARDLALAFPAGYHLPEPTERRFKPGNFADLGDRADFGYRDRFSATAWIRPLDPNGTIVSRTKHVLPEDDTQSNPGWGLYLRDGKLQVNLVNRWLDDCLRLETLQPVSLGQWQHIGFTYDGTRLASGVRIYMDGESVELNVIRDEMNQEIRSGEPLRVGRGLGFEYRGSLRRLLLYARALTPDEMRVAAVAHSLDTIAGIPAVERTPGQARKLEQAYRNSLGPDDLTSLTRRIRELEREREQYFDALPTVMVMQETTPRRPTFRLDRGAYDAPAEPVEPGLPAALSPIDPGSRLGFARWLVSRDNPLTARVTVNRVWQMFWGTGIVKTVEDFGAQGAWPTHPDLLDWLAVEFMESGWNMKALIKTIVMSATYRQSSRLDPDPAQASPDPDNRLFSRGPRLRLPADSIRDLSLAVSGLLVERLGGPSVRPHQPAGLWTELAGGADYQVGRGADLYRRSLYTFWKRAVPPPAMILFDSAGREACTVRSVRTNTPLQALNRMNDSTYLEASRALAGRALRAAGASRDQRLGHIFRLATSRHPNEREIQTLAAGFNFHLDRFRNDPQAASELLGEQPPDTASVPSPEAAAYAVMASLVLNLDETITRE